MSNKLQVLNQQLDSAKTLKSMLSLPIVTERFVSNYEKTTGKKDGLQRLQQEIFLFVELEYNNPKIKACNNFSKYATLMKIATTGLSLRDNQIHLIPRGGVLTSKESGNGKRELLMRMDAIKFVSESQLVLKGDEFVYDKSNSKVISHASDVNKSPALTMDNILAAYCKIEFNDGRIIDILVIQEELKLAREAAPSKNVWDKWTGEMCKKVPYHRAHKLYHRYSEGEYSPYPEYDAKGEGEPEPFSEAKEPSNELTPKEEVKPENPSISDAEIVEEEKPKEETKKEEGKELTGAF